MCGGRAFSIDAIRTSTRRGDRAAIGDRIATGTAVDAAVGINGKRICSGGLNRAIVRDRVGQRRRTQIDINFSLFFFFYFILPSLFFFFFFFIFV